MSPTIDGYFHAKNVRYLFIPSKGINDQRILLFDWARVIPGNTQPKVVVSGAIFPRQLSPFKKS